MPRPTPSPNLLALLVLSVLAHPTLGAAPPATKDSRMQAIDVLRKTLADGASPKEEADRYAFYQRAVTEVLPLVEANGVVTDGLRGAEKRAAGLGKAAAAAVLRDALRDAQETLAFKLKKEAELPEGFPEPTPVGEIRVKQYPAYRLARAAMGDQDSAFWTLFTHIKKHDVAMTAPVEMTYAKGAKKGPPASMAFLYGNVRLGKPGKDGNVEVVDVPARTAVSIGLRGAMTEAPVAAARKRLEAWLADHRAEWAADGPVRVMGYNSPFVPVASRYAEVQIPVRKVVEKK